MSVLMIVARDVVVIDVESDHTIKYPCTQPLGKNKQTMYCCKKLGCIHYPSVMMRVKESKDKFYSGIL